MKKIYLPSLLLILFFSGCEKDYDNVINPSVTGYQVEIIDGPDSLDYESGDSLLYLRLKVTPASALSEIRAVTESPYALSASLLDNGNIANGDTVQGDGIFSARIELSNILPSGIIGINYTASGRLLGKQYFYFDNGEERLPPVLSNLSIKDSAAFEEDLVFTVMAEDPNGLQDIRSVYYELFRPDGSQIVNSQGISKFPGGDDGNTSGNTGDLTAGDGIYSFKLTFPANVPSVPAGRYRFEFTAEDKTSRLSNTIIHFMEVY